MKRSLIMLAAMLTVAAIGNAHAMYCGNHLVMEGDSATRMIEICGHPSSDTFSDIIYLNKDGDGMNYYIHVNGAGMIDSITYSRGGQR